MTEAVAQLLTGTASAAQLARLLGLSTRRLRELAEQGIIPRSSGRYRLPEAVTVYVEHLREVAAGRKSEAGDDALDLVQERAALARAQREHVELKLQRERDEVVDAAEIRLAFTGMVTSARNRLRGVPSKAKARIPALSVRDIEALEELIDSALRELAEGAEATASP